MTQQEPSSGTKPAISMPDEPISTHELKVTRGAANEGNTVGNWTSDNALRSRGRPPVRRSRLGVSLLNFHLPQHKAMRAVLSTAMWQLHSALHSLDSADLPVRCNLSIREPHLISNASCQQWEVKQLLSHAALVDGSLASSRSCYAVGPERAPPRKWVPATYDVDAGTAAGPLGWAGKPTAL